MTPLSQRKQQILRALVEEYIHMATPVASETLVRKYGLKFSSATVRHELAGLEEANLIYQPHTSAGRVPTDLGYRYFVEHLMRESALSLDEQRLIRHQFYQVQDQLDQWVRLTASVMARLLHSAAIMTPPRSNEGSLKHFEILAVTELAAHMVLVLTDGSVKQQRLLLDRPIRQEELSAMSMRLNELFAERNASEIAALATQLDFTPVEQLVTHTICRILEQHGDLFGDVFYREGVINILEQPEYSRLGPEAVRNERMRNVLEVLEQNRLLPALATHLRSQPSDGVQVIIGARTSGKR
ncbi:heat-inducible transcription repressor HrcA [Ktedonospora formicarum]|uniref:Heat-inducible transcription repressor HrcA n=1 Tax=Ktedonospora formicarum TaxID=2778364 RepID=A0A8J3MQ25_9CHLR|nr:heat-inducible transcriptional repressor HrcA [Ktedonospora formicarum]GHO43525.1 heat-inducible transcription repressor HrcA [Ktedonospora formicarum]